MKSRPKHGLGFVFLVAATVILNGALVGKAASWSNTGSMTNARTQFAVSLLQNGRVLVSGGFNAGNQTSAAEVYDAVAGTWSAVGAMTNARYYHTSTLLPNGKVLVTGGLGAGGGFLAGAELFDPALASWSGANPLNRARDRHTATLLPSGKVLVAGGLTDNTGNGTGGAELYDPIGNAWATAHPMTAARWYHTATLLPSGKVLVAGGGVFTNGSSLYPASAELYDPASDTWSSAGSLVSARSEHQAALLPNGRVLVVGGANSSGLLTSAELYDPVSNAWTNTGSLSVARKDFTLTTLPNGKVLAAGGLGAGALTNCDVFDPGTEQWTPVGGLSPGRYFESAVLLTNGNVLAMGGTGAANFLTSAVLYGSSNLVLGTFVLTSPSKVSNGIFTLTFTNTPDVSFSIYGSADFSTPLTNWTLLGGSLEVSPGRYQFSDPQAANYPRRFYAITPP